MLPHLEKRPLGLVEIPLSYPGRMIRPFHEIAPADHERAAVDPSQIDQERSIWF